MRCTTARRALGIAATVFAAAGCGGGTPTAPALPSIAVASGPQVLRITYAGQCAADGQPIFLLLYTRVTVSHSGDQWIASASSPQSGSVELRFRQSRPMVTSSMPIEGTITGVAEHIAGLGAGPPLTNASVNFGSIGSSIIQGVAFAPSALTPEAGVSGVGAGPLTVTDGDGRTCAGSAFSWGLGAQP